jgi:hypothetical protein
MLRAFDNIWFDLRAIGTCNRRGPCSSSVERREGPRAFAHSPARARPDRQRRQFAPPTAIVSELGCASGHGAHAPFATKLPDERVDNHRKDLRVSSVPRRRHRRRYNFRGESEGRDEGPLPRRPSVQPKEHHEESDDWNCDHAGYGCWRLGCRLANTTTGIGSSRGICLAFSLGAGPTQRFSTPKISSTTGPLTALASLAAACRLRLQGRRRRTCHSGPCSTD